MFYNMLKVGFVYVALLTAVAVTTIQAQNSPVKNIVLVHGAWADGSGWKGVYDILVKDGYNVTIVQEPETTFQEDVAATKRVVTLQNGPCILVAHSYGGAVITEAGTDSSVVGLVYIAAHMPDAGENESDDGKRFPSDLSKSNAIKKTADGFAYLDPAQFREYFAADLSAEQAAFMARSQVMNKAENLKGVISTPAWRNKPSWMLVAGGDRTINPDLERWYATRAGSHKVEVPRREPLGLRFAPQGGCGVDRRGCTTCSLEGSHEARSTTSNADGTKQMNRTLEEFAQLLSITLLLRRSVASPVFASAREQPPAWLGRGKIRNPSHWDRIERLHDPRARCKVRNDFAGGTSRDVT